MGKQKFFIQLEEGPIDVSLDLTEEQILAILLDTPEPLLIDTIIETLCRDEILVCGVGSSMTITEFAKYVKQGYSIVLLEGELYLQ